MFVCCFLINKKFPTKSIWYRWLRCSGEYVSVVLHISNCSTITYDIIDAWSRAFNGIIVEPVETSWGGIGIVKAEAALFNTAKTYFPTATHYWLVSETTVPCLPAWRMNNVLQTKRFNSMSMISPQPKDSRCTLNKHEPYSKFNIVCASQFLIINSDHWVNIKKILNDWVNEIKGIPWEQECKAGESVAPDEFVIPTLLVDICGRKNVMFRQVLFEVPNPLENYQHASPLTFEKITWCIIDGKENPPLNFGARKVLNPTPELLDLYISEGMFDSK